MRIVCSYCGPRSNAEFVYHGDATVERPGPGLDAAPDAAALRRWHDYVYLRDNPAGRHRELWYHAGGCRAWLVVSRDLVTHEIHGVEPARAVALARSKVAPR